MNARQSIRAMNPVWGGPAEQQECPRSGTQGQAVDLNTIEEHGTSAAVERVRAHITASVAPASCATRAAWVVSAI
jgi:hypothetical protein